MFEKLYILTIGTPGSGTVLLVTISIAPVAMLTFRKVSLVTTAIDIV